MNCSHNSKIITIIKPKLPCPLVQSAQVERGTGGSAGSVPLAEWPWAVASPLWGSIPSLQSRDNRHAANTRLCRGLHKLPRAACLELCLALHIRSYYYILNDTKERRKQGKHFFSGMAEVSGIRTEPASSLLLSNVAPVSSRASVSPSTGTYRHP